MAPELIGRLDQTLSLVRSFVVNLAISIALVVAVIFVIVELRNRRLVIEPIQVPLSLTELGHTPEEVARQLMEQILVIRQDSTTLKEDLQEVTGEWKLLELEVPEGDTSVQVILNYLKFVLGLNSTQISGEITGDEEIGYRLRLRTQEQKLLPIVEVASKRDFAALLDGGAQRIMAETEPYVLALFLSVRGQSSDLDPELILDLIKASLTNKRRDDDPWAYNLQGLLHHNRGELAEAIRSYDTAISYDSKFAIAYANKAQAWADQVDYSRIQKEPKDQNPDDAAALDNFKQALDNFKTAARLGPDKAGIFFQWGTALYNGGRFEESAKKLKEAARLDPEDAAPLYHWGCALRDLKRKDEAKEKFVLAQQLDPAVLPRTPDELLFFGCKL